MEAVDLREGKVVDGNIGAEADGVVFIPSGPYHPIDDGVVAVADVEEVGVAATAAE